MSDPNALDWDDTRAVLQWLDNLRTA